MGSSDDKPLMEINPPDRDKNGRFARGHRQLGHRRKGVPNQLPHDVKLLIHNAMTNLGADGNGKDGEAGFVERIGRDSPEVLFAGALKTMRPGDEATTSEGLCVTTVVPVVIPRGCFLTAEQAAMLARIEPLDDADAGFDANKFLDDFAAVSPKAEVIDLEAAAPEPEPDPLVPGAKVYRFPRD